jgi:hypothetical protein
MKLDRFVKNMAHKIAKLIFPSFAIQIISHIIQIFKHRSKESCPMSLTDDVLNPSLLTDTN